MPFIIDHYPRDDKDGSKADAADDYIDPGVEVTELNSVSHSIFSTRHLHFLLGKCEECEHW